MSAPGTPKNSQLSLSSGGTPRNLLTQAYNEQFFYENQLLSFQSSSQVSRIVETLITQGANMLYDKYLLDRSPFYEAEDICRWTYHIAIQDNIYHDKGETLESIKDQLTEEQEPNTQTVWKRMNEQIAQVMIEGNQNDKIGNIRLDSRSCLSAKTEFKIIYPEIDNDDMSDTKSNYSRVSGMSRISKASMVRKMKRVVTASQIMGGSTMNLSKTSMQNLERQVSGEEILPQIPKKEEFQVVYVGDDPDRELKRKEEQDDPMSEKLRDLREKKDKEKQIDFNRRQKMQQEEQEVDDRKKEQERQLKNKEFTQDFDGTVIFLNKNRQENIPNDVNVLDCKSKQQVEIVKPVLSDAEIMSSPVKLMNEFSKKKKEQPNAVSLQEFHKQPPLHEVLNPCEGVKIQFQTGLKKQGQEFKNKDSQMSRKQYNCLISDQPNRPIPKYIQNNNKQLKVDINDKANQIIELSEHSSTTSFNKLKRQVKPASAGMHIMNRDALVLMLQEPSNMLQRLQSSQMLHTSKSSLSIKNIQKSQPPEQKKVASNNISDKIRVYETKPQLKDSHMMYQHVSEIEINEDLQELGINLKQMQKKPQQNLNVLVEKFNKKILNDPQWGVSKGEGDQFDRLQPITKLKMPVISRVQSAKNQTRHDSGQSRFTLINQSFMPMSGRPTTANTHSRLSQNQKSFFGVKQI